ncbi:GGDEF domain-containing protein [Bacillus massilinigeriensis]|uniref:GGDEF domain-containing protein n=1 Tax=Bacillus massilionigeriensis TaxID=1805475 RepID=UPI00096B02A1|nr:GGDEF domain-containing protein [Bacillus massilionigeriensis]
MKDIIQSSLSNIAIIFLMHLCLDMLIKRRRKKDWDFFPVSMIAVISVAVILMFYLPIKYGGYSLDLRMIPLILFAYKWGGKYVIPAVFITSLWRLGMGGDGAIPGVIFGLILPVFAGIIFRKMVIESPNIKLPTLFWLILTGWFICDVPVIFFVPDGLAVFTEIVFIRLVSFLLTGFTLNFFITNTEKELRMRDKLKYYAERDPLTDLFNIRFFETNVKSYSFSKKYKYIIMIDIDHFKPINDTYGHLNGDFILKKVASVISETTKKHAKVDTIIGRYGGEEFIIFAGALFKSDMIRLVEDIRMDMEKTTFYTEDLAHRIKLTVSIGVSNLPDYSRLHDAIEQADQSLYKSKKNGRNQVNYVELDNCERSRVSESEKSGTDTLSQLKNGQLRQLLMEKS